MNNKIVDAQLPPWARYNPDCKTKSAEWNDPAPVCCCMQPGCEFCRGLHMDISYDAHAPRVAW